MQKLDIKITKSRLESYNVSFGEDDKVNLTVTIGLYTDEMKKISSFSLSSEAWREENSLVIPIKSYKLIKEIGEQLEELTTAKCREGQLSLNSGDTF